MNTSIHNTTYFVFNNYITLCNNYNFCLYFFFQEKKLFTNPIFSFKIRKQEEDIPNSKIYREKAIH